MKNRCIFAVLLLFASANTLLSQSEDIPPPEPIPAPTPSSPAQAPNPVAQSLSSAANGREMRAYDFGVSYVPTAAGLLVRGVIVDSPAQAAGVKPNDTIVSVNGQPVKSGQSLDGGQIQSVGIMRSGQVQSLKVDGNATGVTTQRARPDRAPASTRYAVPRTTYSAPRSYRYVPPSYRYRVAPDYGYRSLSPYYDRGYYGYGLYDRPSVRIGIGVGSGGYYGRGYPGRRYGGYGRGPGYYGYGRGYGGYGGRSGVGISIGGIGIRF